MPSTGFYSFLPESTGPVVRNMSLCQCPQRASTHFFSSSILEFTSGKCVNALNGLLLISSVFYEKITLQRKRCQCPQRASTHFFIDKAFDIAERCRRCQCPQRASTHFFCRIRKVFKRTEICVNALNGLLLISSESKETCRNC